jgi:hypothetical protein
MDRKKQELRWLRLTAIKKIKRKIEVNSRSN